MYDADTLQGVFGLTDKQYEKIREIFMEQMKGTLGPEELMIKVQAEAQRHDSVTAFHLGILCHIMLVAHKRGEI